MFFCLAARCKQKVLTAGGWCCCADSQSQVPEMTKLSIAAPSDIIHSQDNKKKMIETKGLEKSKACAYGSQPLAHY